MSTDKNGRSVRKQTAAFWRREDERGMLPDEVHQTMSDRWNRFRLDPIAYLDARYSIEYMEPQAHWVNGCPMGNGDLGVLAYGPPEATLFNIGKTDLWDYTPFGEPSYPKGHFADLRNVLARGDVEGVVGFISPHSAPFCADCRRLRLTATGELLGCLAQRRGVDARSLLRADRAPDDATWTRVINEALGLKRCPRNFEAQRPMRGVGG